MALVLQQENEILQDVGSESSGPEFPLGFEGVNKVPLDLMFVEVQMGSETPTKERVCNHTKNRVYVHEGFVGSSSDYVKRIPQTPLLESNFSPS